MRKFINSIVYSKKKRLHCHLFLEKHSDYYEFLSERNKANFVLRSLYFLNNIEVSASEKLRLNTPMKYLIASAFVQLTFGFKRYRLRSFERVFLINEAYSYKDIGVLYHGDTNPKTAQINMVWKVVKEGFEIPDDSLNLAIHEFAHALVLDNKERMSLRKFFPHKKLIKYLLAAKLEMHRIRNGYDSIFRDYGAVNLMEFFAVSVEVFFEQPQRFAAYDELLFERMCLLLNQDPRKVANPRF